MSAHDSGQRRREGRSHLRRESRAGARAALRAVGAALVSLVLVASATWAAESDADSPLDLQIIVNAGNPVRSVTREEAKRAFLKQMSRWDSELRVEPVDQSLVSPVRLAFTRDVLRMERLSDVRAHWQKLIFTGRGTAPPVVNTDAEVIAFVADRPGAVGYVSRSASLPAAVRRIEIDR